MHHHPLPHRAAPTMHAVAAPTPHLRCLLPAAYLGHPGLHRVDVHGGDHLQPGLACLQLQRVRGRGGGGGRRGGGRGGGSARVDAGRQGKAAAGGKGRDEGRRCTLTQHSPPPPSPTIFNCNIPLLAATASIPLEGPARHRTCCPSTSRTTWREGGGGAPPAAPSPSSRDHPARRKVALTFCSRRWAVGDKLQAASDKRQAAGRVPTDDGGRHSQPGGSASPPPFTEAAGPGSCG